MELSTKTVVNNAIDNIEVPKDKRIKEWFEEFNKLPREKRFIIMSDLNKIQSIYVSDGMAEMECPIHIFNLGSFYYKEARKDFYDIKEKYPDMPLEERIDKVKELYSKRFDERKNKRKNRVVTIKL